MNNKLNEILLHKKHEVEELKEKMPFETVFERISMLSPTEELIPALRSHQNGEVTCIAEIKKASPSKGVIAKSFNVEKIAREYLQGGAAALSVLTDKKYFQGHSDHIRSAKGSSHLPILRKDFIVDEYQIYESRMIGADAILLIVAALTDQQLRSYITTAEDLTLSVLVECHSKEEIDRALHAGAKIIGINNRDLQTFTVNVNLSLHLKNFIPNECIAVSESGIRNYHTVEELGQAGFDAILVGEHLMVQTDKAKAMKELLGKRVEA
ncbi:MAG: indole-3-glycerol phosphate synthase TrpC [Ignavibacteriales bacterium]|nr:indole-3-glycerol phosphate synthase TrpC [Ignavibacteriales bacterium]